MSTDTTFLYVQENIAFPTNIFHVFKQLLFIYLLSSSYVYLREIYAPYVPNLSRLVMVNRNTNQKINTRWYASNKSEIAKYAP